MLKIVFTIIYEIYIFDNNNIYEIIYERRVLNTNRLAQYLWFSFSVCSYVQSRWRTYFGLGSLQRARAENSVRGFSS